MKFSLRIFVALVVLALSWVSAQEIAWKGKVLIKEGITIVENPGTPIISQQVLELQEDYIICGAGKDYYLDNPCHMILDAKNNLYISDIGESNIKVFDERGLYLQTIGRKGIGPGELDGLSDIAIQGSLLVAYSSGLRRLSYFDLSGKLMRTRSALMGLGGMQLGTKGNLFGLTTFADAKGQMFYKLNEFNNNLEYVRTIGPQVQQPRLINYGISCPFFIVSKDGDIIFGFPDKYEYLIYNNDAVLKRRIRKKYIPIPIPKEDRDQVLNKANPFGMDIPEHYAPYYGILVNEEGRIFLNTAARLSSLNTYDVFDHLGRFLATVKIRSYRQPLWANKRVYTIEQDDDGYFFIRVSLVKWKH